MHGTSITLIGQLSKNNTGTNPLPLTLDVPEDTPIELSDEFAMVPYAEDLGADILLELIEEGNVHPNEAAHVGVQEESWLNHISSINKNKVDDKWQLNEVPVTFSGFFSKHQDQEDVKPWAVISTFPVFNEEKADTIRMQKHAMLVVKKAIAFVNPGQIPVLEGDCPL